MATPGSVFTTSKGREVCYVERHQGMAADFWYLDNETGREFDVRELPAAYIANDGADVRLGDRDAHRRAIRRALVAGFDFKRSK